MDLHRPGGPVRSLKDFLVHLGIVTLGILNTDVVEPIGKGTPQSCEDALR